MIGKQCHLRSIKHQRGFSLFEIVVVVLIIGMLMTMAMDRLARLQIEVERVSVQHIIGTMDSAVYLQTAEMVLKQGLSSMRKMENANPMDYLARLPDNYMGLKSGEAAKDVPVANWYFDPVEDVLIYKVKHNEYFESSIEGEPRIQLKLSLVYRDDIKSRRIRNIQGIKLESLHEYNWKPLEG